MGFRFRKSINLGHGIKINLSKSGIGYSFGIPGIRFTQSANGKKRTTYSIPGTGISYVNEKSSTKKTKRKAPEKIVKDGEADNTSISAESGNYKEFIENSRTTNKKGVNNADLLREGLIIISALALGIYYKNMWIFAAGVLIWLIYAKYNDNKS